MSSPSVQRPGSLLFAFPRVGRRWSAGLRAALAFGVPALIAVASGYTQQSLVVTLGAFAVLYGEGRPYRTRWWVVLTAGAALLAAATLGSVVGHVVFDAAAPDRAWPFVVEVVLVTVVGVVGSYVVDAARLGPPGAFFAVLVAAVAVLMGKSGLSPATVVVCTAVGVVSALVVSMAGVVRDRTKPERSAVAAAERAVAAYLDAHTDDEPAADARHAAGAALSAAWGAVYDAAPNEELQRSMLATHRRFAGVASADPDTAADHLAPQPRPQIPLSRPTLLYRLRRSVAPDSHATITALRVGVASLVSGGVSILFGLDRPDWAVLATVLVLHQGPDRVRGTVRGLHRFAGTIVGLVLFVGLFHLSLRGAALVLVLMVLQFLIELFIVRNYGVAVAFITPVALLIGGANSTAGIATVVRDRLVETALGAVVGVLALWIVAPRSHRRNMLWAERRALDIARRLVDEVTRNPADGPHAMRLRRDLQFELVGCARSGIHAAHDEREWTERHWQAHAEVGRLGYDLLGACWSASGTTVGDREGWTNALRRADGATR